MRTIVIDMTKNENPLIVLPNAINKARFNFSLPTQKLFLHLVSKITYEERKEGKFLKTLEFTLDEMESFFKMTGRERDKNLKGLLKECVNEIGNNNIKYSEINERGKEYWVNYPWSSKSVIDEDKGVFIFEFNDKISWFLLQVKGFFKSQEEEYLKLTSSHAISLYMLFRSNEFQNKIQPYYIEDLKKYLGLENNYDRWEAFKRIVLDPSVIQLNKETNYFFTYETKRIGRSIGKVEIRVIDKKNKEEFSDYFLEKIQEFLKKEKTEASVRKNFNLMKYEYDAQKNCINIYFKNEKILNDFLQQNPMFGIKNTSSSDILTELLDKHIVSNKEFQRYIKSMFRKGLKIYYK